MPPRLTRSTRGWIGESKIENLSSMRKRWNQKNNTKKMFRPGSVWIGLGDRTQPPIRGVGLDWPGGGSSLDWLSSVWVGLGEGSARISLVWSGWAWGIGPNPQLGGSVWIGPVRSGGEVGMDRPGSVWIGLDWPGLAWGRGRPGSAWFGLNQTQPPIKGVSLDRPGSIWGSGRHGSSQFSLDRPRESDPTTY